MLSSIAKFFGYQHPCATILRLVSYGKQQHSVHESWFIFIPIYTFVQIILNLKLGLFTLIFMFIKMLYIPIPNQSSHICTNNFHSLVIIVVSSEFNMYSIPTQYLFHFILFTFIKIRYKIVSLPLPPTWGPQPQWLVQLLSLIGAYLKFMCGPVRIKKQTLYRNMSKEIEPCLQFLYNSSLNNEHKWKDLYIQLKNQQT